MFKAVVVVNEITLQWSHYHFDIFNAAIDFQLQELDSRFGERTMKLLTLSSAFDPNDAYKQFNINDICTLVEKCCFIDLCPILY
jgi:hypothetical protein